MKKVISIALLVAAGLGSGWAQAQEASFLVEFQGPGGHSSGNYGRTSALHAAARSLMELRKQALPAGAYTVTTLTGGNSVNSIASDGVYRVKLNAQAGVAPGDFLAMVTTAAQAGASAENAFRNVKPGDLTAGAPADIRFTITQE